MKLRLSCICGYERYAYYKEDAFDEGYIQVGDEDFYELGKINGEEVVACPKCGTLKLKLVGIQTIYNRRNKE